MIDWLVPSTIFIHPVIVTGGIVAKVTKIVDDSPELEAEIADGIKIKVVRALVTEVRSKTEVLKEQAANKA